MFPEVYNISGQVRRFRGAMAYCSDVLNSAYKLYVVWVFLCFATRLFAELGLSAQDARRGGAYIRIKSIAAKLGVLRFLIFG